MRKTTIGIPVYLPEPLYRLLRTLRGHLTSIGHQGRLDLSGDREIEWSWIVRYIPFLPQSGRALDFGSGPSGYLGLTAARCGYQVTCLDLEPVAWAFDHPLLRSLQGDVKDVSLQEEDLDLVINCSAIEHVGLAGRYGVAENSPEGDLQAMARLRSLMRHGGVMLLTIPVGRDAVFAPLHRVYGNKRLPALLDGFVVEKSEFWTKNERNHWVITPENQALSTEPQERLYGLGCFVLSRP